jgi:hypothetical protein
MILHDEFGNELHINEPLEIIECNTRIWTQGGAIVVSETKEEIEAIQKNQNVKREPNAVQPVEVDEHIKDIEIQALKAEIAMLKAEIESLKQPVTLQNNYKPHTIDYYPWM